VFRLGDLHFPEAGRVLGQIGPDVRICGEVEYFSDRGADKDHFAIVSAPGIETPLIIPVARLELISAEKEERPALEAAADRRSD